MVIRCEKGIGSTMLRTQPGAALGGQWLDAFSGASYRRIGVRDERRFVTACLTMEAAKRFIEDNQHHLRNPFVYAESLSNNPEMIAVRKHLAECIRRES